MNFRPYQRWSRPAVVIERPTTWLEAGLGGAASTFPWLVRRPLELGRYSHPSPTTSAPGVASPFFLEW